MPPTDNLYKFIFISGILVYLYSLTFAVKQFREYWDQTKKYEEKVVVVHQLVEKDSIKLKILNYQFRQETNLELSKLNLLALDSLELNTTQQNLFKDYFLIASNLKKNQSLLKSAKDRLTEPILYEGGARYVFIYLFAFSIVLIPFGFYHWYLKLHVPNRIILDAKVNKIKGNDTMVSKFISENKMYYIALSIGLILFVVPLGILGFSTTNYKKSIKERTSAEKIKADTIRNATVLILKE